MLYEITPTTVVTILGGLLRRLRWRTHYPNQWRIQHPHKEEIKAPQFSTLLGLSYFAN